MTSVSVIAILVSVFVATRGKELKYDRSGDTLNCTPVHSELRDAVFLPSYDGRFNRKGVNLNYTTGQIKVTGLENSIIDGVSISNMNNEDALGSIYATIPYIQLYSDSYRLSGTAQYVYPISGSGKMIITLNDVKLRSDFFLEKHNEGSKVSDLILDYKVAKVHFDLQHASWPINTLLNRDGTAILNSNRDTVSQALQNALIRFASEFTANKKPNVALQYFTDYAACFSDNP